jgi:hypothetical protein
MEQIIIIIAKYFIITTCATINLLTHKMRASLQEIDPLVFSFVPIQLLFLNTYVSHVMPSPYPIFQYRGYS